MKMLTLYHFTTKAHLDSILSDGFLRTTESNLSGRREHAGPDVVWLTSNPDPVQHRGWGWRGPNAGVISKTEVRFTVEIPMRDAHRWWDWSARRGIDRVWAQRLASVGGSRSWVVVERSIPGEEWLEVVDVATGLSLAVREVS